jgi:hypothetical protein
LEKSVTAMPNDTRTDAPEPEPGVALPDDDVLRERVARSRAAKGLPPTVEDPAAIAQVVAAFTAVPKPVSQ